MPILILVIILLLIPNPSHAMQAHQTCSDEENYFALANAYFAERDFEAALQAIECEIVLSPENARLHLFRAVVNFWLADIDEALADIDRYYMIATQADASVVEGLLLEADFLTYAGQYEEVVELEQTLVERILDEMSQPETDEFLSTAYTIVGESHIYQEQFDEAIDVLNEAIHYNAENTSAFFWRSVANSMLDNTTQAEQDREEAQRLSPNLHTSLREAGVKFRLMGNDAQAIRLYTYAIDMSDGNISIYFASTLSISGGIA